jgi:hypothetical protein
MHCEFNLVTCAGARRLKSLSVTSFRSASVLAGRVRGCRPATCQRPRSCRAYGARPCPRQMRMSLRGTGLRPDDLTGELFGVDEHDRFCRQFFRRAGPRCREIVMQNFGRFGVKRHVERSPEQIDATACERWRVIWISAEFRPAVIRCPPPPIREWPVAALGVERPDVEVLDAIRSVQIVEGSPLTQRPAHEPAGVAPRTPRVAREQSCFDIRSEVGQSQEVIPVDARERSPLMGRHLSRIPFRGPAASCRGRQELQAAAGAFAWTRLLPASRVVRWGDVPFRLRPARPRSPVTSSEHQRRWPRRLLAGFLSLEVVAAADRAPSYPRPAHPVYVRSAAKSAPSCVSESACLRRVYGRCVSSHVLAVHR